MNEHIETDWCIYLSVNYVDFGLDDSLALTIQTIIDYLSGIQEHLSVKFKQNISIFIQERQYENVVCKGAHFVSTSMSWNQFQLKML